MDEEKGTVAAYGERFLFIPVKLIHSIEDRLVTGFGPAVATSFQYEIGREGGKEYMRIAKNAGYNVNDLQDVKKLAQQLGTLAGWGRIEVEDVDVEKRLVRIRWTNGVSVRNRKGETPVCHFGRGILTGCVEAAFGRRCESLELACEGKGDGYCEGLFGDPGAVARMANTQKLT